MKPRALVSAATAPGYEADDERTRAHFGQRLGWQVGDARVGDWGSRASQELRFEILCTVASGPAGLEGCRVLDLGCGQADLYAWLLQRGVSCDYTGVELEPQLAARARQRFGQATPEAARVLVASAAQAELFDAAAFDYVFASGLFYLRRHEPLTWMRAVLENAWTWCERGLAFNSLSAWASAPQPGEFHPEPLEVLALAQRLSPRLVLRHDYHPRDFSVLVLREQPCASKLEGSPRP